MAVGSVGQSAAQQHAHHAQHTSPQAKPHEATNQAAAQQQQQQQNGPNAVPTDANRGQKLNITA